MSRAISETTPFGCPGRSKGYLWGIFDIKICKNFKYIDIMEQYFVKNLTII